MNTNRRTPQDQQQFLSPEAKLEHLMCFGELEDKWRAIKSSPSFALKVFETRLKNNISLTDKRKHFLRHLIDLAS